MGRHRQTEHIQNAPLKQCRWCATVKPITEFYKSASGKDGRCAHCKDCTLAGKKGPPKRDPSAPTEACSVCKIVKPRSDFQGRYSKCKPCAYVELSKRRGIKTGQRGRVRSVEYLPDAPPRTCLWCHSVKLVTDFYKNQEGKGGRATHCKDCALSGKRSPNRRDKTAATKTCTRCHIEKPCDEFYAGRRQCKPCHIVNRDPAKTREAARRFRQRHPERVHAAAKKKRAKLSVEAREQLRLKSAAWVKANPDKAKASRDRWNNKNRGRLRENDRKWAKANRDKKRIHEFTRRAREAGAGGKATPEQVKARIDFCGGLCWICQAPYQDVDHTIPLAKGGTNWPANLRAICKPCNSKKGFKHPSQIRRSTTITPCPLPG